MTPKQQAAVIEALWDVVGSANWINGHSTDVNARIAARSIRSQARKALKALGQKDRPKDDTP